MSAVASLWSSKSQWSFAARAKCALIFSRFDALQTMSQSSCRAAIHDEVVEDRPALVAGAGVHGLPVDELLRVVRDEVVDDVGGVLAAQPELAHVADVEEAGGRAHRLVLVDDARVLDRHLPAREGDDARPQGDVLLVEGRASQRRIGHRVSKLEDPAFGAKLRGAQEGVAAWRSGPRADLRLDEREEVLADAAAKLPEPAARRPPRRAPAASPTRRPSR